MENQGGNLEPKLSDKRLAEAQAKVNEVVGVMKINIEKIVERGENLSEMEKRAGELEIGAEQFEQQAGKLKRKYWWQNLKMMLIIGAVGVVLLIIIIVWATSGFGSSNSPAVSPTPAPTAAPPPQ